ncbi:MAG: hypothetical protein ACK48B_07450 [Dolichospermum sp.]
MSVVSCSLLVVSCQWSVVSGQLSVVSCQWLVVSGQWSVVSGHSKKSSFLASLFPVSLSPFDGIFSIIILFDFF